MESYTDPSRQSSVWAQRKHGLFRLRGRSLTIHSTVKGFPYYPAEIVNVDLDYDEIGERVWSEKPKTAGNERVWLVRFYDRTRSYAWVTQGYLANLGDDKGASACTAGMDVTNRYDTEQTWMKRFWM